MDFYRNIDKVSDAFNGVSYNQITQVDRAAVVSEPVSLSALKDYGKISGNSEDALLTALITASREICETFTGVNFVQREVTAWFNNFNGGTYLPYGPIGTITGVYDNDGGAVSYDAQGGEFKQILSPKIALKAIYQGGHATCPEIFKTAIKAQALFMFENRSTDFTSIFFVAQISQVAMMLLKPYQRNV